MGGETERAVYIQRIDPEQREEWERYVGKFKRDGVDVENDPGKVIPFMERIWSFTPDDP